MRFEKGSGARPQCACPGLTARSGTVLSTHIEDPPYLTVHIRRGEIPIKDRKKNASTLLDELGVTNRNINFQKTWRK